VLAEWFQELLVPHIHPGAQGLPEPQSHSQAHYWTGHLPPRWHSLRLDNPGHHSGQANSGCWKCFHIHVWLATGQAGRPPVQIQTGKPLRFISRFVQKPSPLLRCCPSPVPYISTSRIPQQWLYMSAPISSSPFQVVLFMVAFSYPTVNHKILTIVGHCSFWM